MKITRRDFLKTTAGLAAAASLGLPGKAGAAAAAKVVLVRDRDVLGPNGEIRAAVLQKMLDEGLCTLLEKKEPIAAWQTLFRKSDVVGIKSNDWRHLPTPPEMEEAIRKRLLDVGIRSDDIAVGDRGVLQNPSFLKATALVNTRPVRSHHWSGVGTLLKNYIQFVPSPSDYHPNGCATLAASGRCPS